MKEINKCDICHARFGEKQKLQLHVATVHEGKKPFKCAKKANYFWKN